jgi:hypothetical protein
MVIPYSLANEEPQMAGLINCGDFKKTLSNSSSPMKNSNSACFLILLVLLPKAVINTTPSRGKVGMVTPASIS